jgi:acyl carrier protein
VPPSKDTLTPGLMPDADFFDLGGDSLMAETLMAAIERDFGVALSIAIVLKNPTPAHLARVVAAKRGKPEYDEADIEDRCLVPIRPNGEGLPILCIHGQHGVSEFARELAEKVILRRQFFGFRAMGLRRGEKPLPTVQKIAAHYIAEIKSVRPNGPYIVYGQCPTAYIAYEIAQRLVQGGDTVAGLILVDPFPTIPAIQYLGAQLIAEKVRLTESFARQMTRFPAGGFTSAAARDKFIFDLFIPIVGAYTPKPFAGKALLICSQMGSGVLLNKTTGFPALIADLQTATIRGHHLDPFKAEAGEVSKLIADFLDRIDPLS